MKTPSGILAGFLLLIPFMGFGQEKESAVTLTGYLSSLQSSMFSSPKEEFVNDFLLHNRLLSQR